MRELAAMLEEWPWLTPEQAKDLGQLSERMRRDCETTDVAIARLSARALRFAVENGQLMGPLVVVVAPPDWGSQQLQEHAESLSELGHEVIVAPHGTVVHVVGRETITGEEVERLRALSSR